MTGLAVVFDVAENAMDGEAFAGLTVLSHVAADNGLPDVRPIHPSALVNPTKRVGLRPIANDFREDVVLLNQDAASKTSLADAYRYYCQQFGCKVNSSVVKKFSVAGVVGDVKVFDITGCFVCDRGILAVLEVGRHCKRLEVLNFAGNGLTNTGVECVADFALASSPEVSSYSTNLRRIDLADNRITIGGAMVMLEVLHRRPLVVFVGLDGTKVEAALRARVATAAQNNVDAANAASD
jgi:hypothetical protein